MAPYLSYQLSAGHFRQWQTNRRNHPQFASFRIMMKLVLGTGVALFVALGVGWAWGTSGRSDINRALQITELRHGVLERRAAVPHPHDLAPIARALRGRGVAGTQPAPVSRAARRSGGSR